MHCFSIWLIRVTIQKLEPNVAIYECIILFITRNECEHENAGQCYLKLKFNSSFSVIRHVMSNYDRTLTALTHNGF